MEYVLSANPPLCYHFRIVIKKLRVRIWVREPPNLTAGYWRLLEPSQENVWAVPWNRAQSLPVWFFFFFSSQPITIILSHYSTINERYVWYTIVEQSPTLPPTGYLHWNVHQQPWTDSECRAQRCRLGQRHTSQRASSCVSDVDGKFG